tara:strand:- start:328 stop:582 length:255 start_codon:yes stop_codon:yes gene_type:complete
MENYKLRTAQAEQEENVREFSENNEEEAEDYWLKTTSVCELISCSPATVGRLRDKGLLKSSKIMGTYYYLQSDVDQMMNNGRVN